MNALLNAWETTIEDVENALRRMNEDIALAPELYGKLDLESIAQAALDAGNDIDSQFEGACGETMRQIKAL